MHHSSHLRKKKGEEEKLKVGTTKYKFPITESLRCTVRTWSLSECQCHLHEHVFWSYTNPRVPAAKNPGIHRQRKNIWELFSWQLSLLIYRTVHTHFQAARCCLLQLYLPMPNPSGHRERESLKWSQQNKMLINISRVATPKKTTNVFFLKPLLSWGMSLQATNDSFGPVHYVNKC